RLDHVKAYNSDSHYRTYVYLARRWVHSWGDLACSEITQEMVQSHILERHKISGFTANKDLRYLRAAFNYGMKRKLVKSNPTEGIEFLPIERKIRYVPTVEEINRVLDLAKPDVQDYLWVIRDTFARVGEINRLTWDDVNFNDKYIILYTRKKRHGHLSPRKVAMTEKLYEILSRRSVNSRSGVQWVFWQRYKDRSTGKIITGPFQYRRTILRTLCKKAGVRYFGFHALRHSGASLMDRNNVPIGSIQRILGHENRQTTEIYLHSIEQAEREAVAVYERARENSHTTLT
ncbi:MAG: site-specific integrase, partial [Desulfobacterales bacterium]